MTRMAVVWSAAAVVLVASSVTVQTPPNFSGRWILEPDPAAPTGAAGRGGRGAPATMGSGWGADITLTQDASTLTVEYAQFGRGDMQPPMRFVYMLNGAESRNAINMGRGPQDQISKAAWDGSKLVLTTVHAFKNPQSGAPMTSETTQVLSLESPASLAVDTTRSGVLGGKPSTTKTMYKKN